MGKVAVARIMPPDAAAEKWPRADFRRLGRVAESPARDQPVLLFDGVCNLCHGAVQWVIARDPGARFRFASLQSQAGRRVLREAGFDGPTPDSVVLVADGRVHLRSDAALETARRLGGVWKAAVALRVLPRALRDALYAWVARNRYRWFGRKQECPMPSPETLSRFLDADEDPVSESPQGGPPEPEHPPTMPTGKAFFVSWGARLVAAFIMGQTLYFKFSGAPEPVWIFERLGVEPWGRYLTGTLEAVAVVLLLMPRTAGLGGLLTVGLMGGAVMSHVAILGIEVQDDGGTLFAMAWVTLACGAVTAWLHRASLPLVGARGR